MKIKFIIILMIILIILFSFIWYYPNFTKSGCLNFGGKWASNGGYCIDDSCYDTGDCGIWANPVQWCDKLTIGDSIKKVYFWLGNPSIQGDEYSWEADKASGEIIRAKIVGGKLQELDCKKQ